MSLFVVDASVAAKWYFDEELSKDALRFLEQGHEMIAPDLFFAEMDSLLLKRVRRKEVSVPAAQVTRQAFRRIQVQLHSLDSLSDGAFEIAIRTGASIYDCFYLALAVATECKVVTADRRFCNAIRSTSLGRYIIWFQDVSTL